MSTEENKATTHRIGYSLHSSPLQLYQETFLSPQDRANQCLMGTGFCWHL